MQVDRRRRKQLSLLASVLAAVVVLAVVSWALFVDRELYDLRWKLRPGEVLRYRTVMRMDSTVSQTHEVMLQRYTIGRVDADGTAEVTSLLEQVTIRNGGPQGTVVWDSASGAAAPKDFTIAPTAAMVGVPLLYKIDVRGNVLSKEGMDVVQKRHREIMGDQGIFDISDMAFSGTHETILGPVLPSVPVKRGSRWTMEGGFGTQAWGKTKFLSGYSLKEVRKGVATIVLTESKTVEETPGDIPKAMNIKTPPDPNAKHGNEDATEFSIAEGIMVAQRTRGWTQSTTTKGTLFRFEAVSEMTLIERRAGPR